MSPDDVSKLREYFYARYLHGLKSLLSMVRGGCDTLIAENMAPTASNAPRERQSRRLREMDRALDVSYQWLDQLTALVSWNAEELVTLLQDVERGRWPWLSLSNGPTHNIPSAFAVPSCALVLEVVRWYLGGAATISCIETSPSILSLVFRQAGQPPRANLDEPMLGRHGKTGVVQFGGDQFVKEAMESMGGSAIFSDTEVTLCFPIGGSK